MINETPDKSYQHKGSKKFMLVIILCFILPPLGVYMAYRWRHLLKDGGTKLFYIKVIIIVMAGVLGSLVYVVGYSKVQDNRHPSRKVLQESQELLKQQDGISYKGQTLEEYIIPGVQQKTKDGMTFKVPEIFTQAPGYEQQKVYNSAVHMSSITEGQVVTSISGASHTQLANASGEKAGLSDAAITKSFDKRDSQYLATNGQLRKYITNSLLPQGYTAVLGEPEEFRADNVQKNAWVFELTAINAKGETVAIEGNAYVIYGNGTYYYFVIYTLPYNWIPNHAVWRDIENSIKIDQ